jgi:hypothetical protein
LILRLFKILLTVREVDQVYIFVFLLKSVAGITAGVQDQSTQAEIQTVCTVKKNTSTFSLRIMYCRSALVHGKIRSLYHLRMGQGKPVNLVSIIFSNSSQSSNFHTTFHQRFDKDYMAFRSD